MSHEVVSSCETPAAPAAWRRAKQARPVPQHNWQVALPAGSRPGKRWRSLRLFGLLTVLAGLMAAFVLVAVDVPRKTPLLIVTDLRPGAIPQTPWLVEEIERLKLLDHTTLTVRECRAAAADGFNLAEFHRSLQDMVPAADQSGMVIVYVRLPGLVDDAGRPCLIPPQASLLRTDEWLPAEELLEHLAGELFPAHVRRLVIFDRCQPARIWQAGVLADSFPDRLTELVKRRYSTGRWQTLAVLSDTSPGEAGWASPSVGGSVFGEAFWTALTGRADATECGGNADRHVSLAELAQFTIDRTARWARANRRQCQTPTFISSAPSHGDVLWAAADTRQRVWQAESHKLCLPVDRDSALKEMSELWRARLTLEQQAPWRFDPVGWQQLNHLLLSYERLIAGGQGAARQREDVVRSLRSRLNQLAESVSCRLPLKKGEVRLHHRHLAYRQNPNAGAEFERVARVFEQLREHPSRSIASQLLGDLQRDGGLPADWDLVVLQHLIDDAPDTTWSNTELLSRVLRLQELLGDLQSVSEAMVGRILTRQTQSVEADYRAIVDRLFIGTDDDLVLAEERLSVAELKLADCEQAVQQLTRALCEHDRAAAELPRLAAWMFAPHDAADPLARQRITEWTVAAQSWKQLEQAIGACREQGGDADAVALVGTLSTQLEGERCALWDYVDQEFDRLLTGEMDAAKVTAMEHLLSTSLLPRKPDSRSRTPVEQRICLHESWRQASTQLELEYAATQSPMRLPQPDASVVSNDCINLVVRGSTPHPMILMLDARDPASNTAQTVSQAVGDESMRNRDRDSAKIRRHLASIPQRLQRERFASFDSPALRDRTWQVQATQLREAACWLPGDLACNPCQRTELAAWAGQLRARAACMSEDFWLGPADSAVPFYVRAADDLLNAADLCEASFATSLTAAGKAEASVIRQRLVRSALPERRGLGVTAVAVPQILSTDDLVTTVSVSQSPEGSLPAGTAAVFIGEPDRSAERTAMRAAVELKAVTPATKSPVTTTVQLRCALPTAQLNQNRSGRAVAYFRGHRFVDGFQLAPTGGLIVRSIPATPSPASVVVHSHQARPNAILFILDASASMTDDVAREGTRGSVRKLDAAVEALTLLLNDLAELPGVQAGVMIYGHRVAAGDTPEARVMRQPLYLQRYPFAPGLQPFEDVETVLPIGRFGVAERSTVEERLRCLRPWGETPLYLSIVEGLRQFESVTADVNKTLVVVTDGLNYQFNPSADKKTELEDVLRAVSGRDVAVHLVGFGIDDQQVEQARREFSKISAATGGSSDVTVRDAARLQAYLRALTLPARFSVEGRNGFQQTAQVGQPIPLPQLSTAEERFRVRFETASIDITIAGGEKLAFCPAEEGTLRVVAELPERSVSLREHATGANAPCELVASRPVWKGDQLSVRWSLRRRDGQFTPRPHSGYFLLQPLDYSGAEVGPAAVCLGPADLLGQPLPTWEFQLPAWPRTAVIARLRGWISMTALSPENAQSCTALLEKQQAEETWQALPSSNVRWQIRHDGESVTLIERYATAIIDAPVQTQLIVDRSQTAAVLRNVDRRFDAEHRLFVQTWNFDRRLTPLDMENLQFEFTRLDPIPDQCWDLTESVVVPIMPETLVIRPVPAIGR